MEFETFTITADKPVQQTAWTWSESIWMYVQDDAGEWWVNRQTFERRPYDPELDS